MKVLEFVDRLAETLDVSRESALATYRAFVETLMACLAEGEEVKFENLGKLSSYRRPALQGRPGLQSEQAAVQIEVQFQQFRSSRSELLSRCPIQEEIDAAERLAAERDATEKGRSHRRPSHLRAEPDRNLAAPSREKTDPTDTKD